MSEARFEQYNEVLNSLVSECISCSPESWDFGVLTIDCDGNAINYKLKNETDGNKAQISQELRRLCEELYVIMRQNGDIWVEAVIDFFKKDDTWGFKVNFKYESTTNSNQAPAQKKAWWKVW